METATLWERQKRTMRLLFENSTYGMGEGLQKHPTNIYVKRKGMSRRDRRIIRRAAQRLNLPKLKHYITTV